MQERTIEEYLQDAALAYEEARRAAEANAFDAAVAMSAVAQAACAIIRAHVDVGLQAQVGTALHQATGDMQRLMAAAGIPPRVGDDDVVRP